MRKFAFTALLMISALASAAVEKVASPILVKPSAQAKAENKLVFVVFSASWCGPCRALHATLEHGPAQPIWDKYFVTASVIVDENGDKVKLDTPGGNELRTKLGGDNAGIPFFAILRPDGTVLGNSYMQPGKNNMGCPMSAEELAAFDNLLRAAAPKMTAADREKLVACFRKPAGS
jgi:thiol-disulfide isomerase/thioredoxin